MLILAFDTATDVATSALVDDAEVLGERTSIARTLLEDVDALLRQASARPSQIDAIVVGTGPGSFTSTRVGLAVARGLALALEIDGRRRVDARCARGGRGACVARDRRAARRGLRPGREGATTETSPPTAGSASGTAPSATATCSKRNGALVPADDDPRHVPHARLHARLATSFGPVDAIEPIYVRAPDAKQMDDRDARPAAPRARRPRRDRADRAGLVSDAVVAVDVRDGARQAELAVARRNRRVRRAGRVPRPLALRRRLARDERGRRPRGAPQGGRDGPDRARLLDETRHDAQRGYTLEVRVSNVGAIKPLRALRVQAEGRSARVLHGQPRGRAHHVARSRARRRRARCRRGGGAA